MLFVRGLSRDAVDRLCARHDAAIAIVEPCLPGRSVERSLDMVEHYAEQVNQRARRSSKWEQAGR
jgi:hypothetical protein